ncbi:hypothetical protein Q3G72_033480 [Acer saccharum]|nr:hypothetical protein Q3G72_033480 [Acer saccharum]
MADQIDQKPDIFELNNGSMQVKITNYGATITSLSLPDKNGKQADVVLGFDSVEPYVKGVAPYFGAIVGRVANRIKEGKFTLDGAEYALPINKPPNSLHGHNSGNILDNSIQIWGSHITPVDQNTVPTGEIMPVKGTPFDFTTEKKIGASIHEVPGLGYDHNYVLDCGEEKSGLKHAAKLKDPSSSRVLNLWTDAPGMQFYTANYVNGVAGKGGAVYGKHSGVCLETQGFPNAINQPNFPSVVVRPGEKYKHTMLFEFSVE